MSFTERAFDEELRDLRSQLSAANAKVKELEKENSELLGLLGRGVQLMEGEEVLHTKVTELTEENARLRREVEEAQQELEQCYLNDHPMTAEALLEKARADVVFWEEMVGVIAKTEEPKAKEKQNG